MRLRTLGWVPATALLLAARLAAQRVGNSATTGVAVARPSSRADTPTSSFDVGGVRVILRRNTATDVAAANLYLLGGTQQLEPATQGIEALLLAASERGTRSYPDDAARRRIARLGSTLTVEPAVDWTLFAMRALRSTFDSTWAVFADRVMHPSLDSAQVELTRQQLLTAAQQARTQPDAALQWLADSISFAGAPYGLSPNGTPASLRTITVQHLRAYHAKQFVTSRMLLVVVGNIDREHLTRLVTRTLSRLPRGGYAWKVPLPRPTGKRIPYVERESLPTNYLLGYYVGPPASSADYQALRLASAVLSGRFFTEIRSKRSLTYAVEAPFLARAFAVGGVYVTTVEPDTVLHVMRDLLDELQRDTVASGGLRRLVQQFITDYYLRNETNGDQATLLAEAALYDHDFTAADRLVDELRRVTPDDIRRVARQYMRDFQFVYVGDPAKLPAPEMLKF